MTLVLDFDLNPMTFIYELDPYCLEIHRMCTIYKLPTSRLPKVIVWQTDIHCVSKKHPRCV